MLCQVFEEGVFNLAVYLVGRLIDRHADTPSPPRHLLPLEERGTETCREASRVGGSVYGVASNTCAETAARSERGLCTAIVC
jgi:hypothetical protein